MKIKKRLLPMLLSLCLCFGLSALSVRPAYAADLAYEVPGGKLYFDAQTGTITSSDKTVTEADIPAEIYGVPVTAIGGYAFTRRYDAEPGHHSGQRYQHRGQGISRVWKTD